MSEIPKSYCAKVLLFKQSSCQLIQLANPLWNRILVVCLEIVSLDYRRCGQSVEVVVQTLIKLRGFTVLLSANTLSLSTLGFDRESTNLHMHVKENLGEGLASLNGRNHSRTLDYAHSMPASQGFFVTFSQPEKY